MSYIGDFALGSTFDTKFCTVTTTGAPTQLAGTPVISAYPDNSTTQLTAGITLTVDFDTVTGLNNVRVVATSGNGYAAGSNYQLVITTGTVGGTSVVGYVVAEFSIEARSALRPTTSGRTLDVSAGGEAGVDWANVGSATTVVGLTGTTVKTATDVETDTADIQTRIPAALVGGRIDANMGAISTDATAADNLEAALDGTGLVTITAGITGDITGNLSGSVGSVTGAVGSVTGNVGGNVTGSVGSLAAQAKTDVNAEVLDVLNVDTFAEPGQEAPGATVSLVKKIGYLYKFLRNKKTQDSTTLSVYADDATTVDQKATISDDGSTYTHGEIASGP